MLYVECLLVTTLAPAMYLLFFVPQEPFLSFKAVIVKAASVSLANFRYITFVATVVYGTVIFVVADGCECC